MVEAVSNKVKPKTVARILRLWGRMSPYPGGRWLFSRFVGFYVPYSGSIGVYVEKLAAGYALTSLKERWRVRNHLRCIHAVALVNLGEITSGMAMYASLPPHARGIVVSIEANYLKKARGRLVAESHCDLPEITQRVDFPLFTEVRDAQGDVVAQLKVVWRLEPRP